MWLLFKKISSEFITNNFSITEFGEFRTNLIEKRLKRISEFLFSIFLLLVSSPIIVISAIFIKFEDGGPVFYSQVRTGLMGKQFSIFKLRTMRTNAEREGIQWSKSTDKRITRVGSILRKLRIDELPQLICVITGDMSLIGPRPERPLFDEQLSKEIPFIIFAIL